MVAVAIMGIVLTAAAQQWSFILRRELERELIYRGGNIVTAIQEYQTSAQNQRLPTKLEDLTKRPRPTLRKVWVDPMTARYDGDGKLIEGTGEWELLRPSAPSGQQAGRSGGRQQPRTNNPRAGNSRLNVQGVVGVASKSEELSIGSWGDSPPESVYSEWRFEVVSLNQSTGQVNTFNRTGVRTSSPGEVRPPGFAGTTRKPGDPPPPGSPLGRNTP
jgi:type II secretory pathway pseudopilin PulG